MSKIEEAKRKIGRYCAYQDRSEKEIRQQLKKYSLAGEEEEEIIVELKKAGFLDEERFVQSYIRGKMSCCQWGRQMIKARLLQKMIPIELINRQLETVDEEEWNKAIRIAIEKWLRSNRLGPETKPKLYRYLMSKGYEYDIIVNQLQEYDREN